jgi:hypothetical protein
MNELPSQMSVAARCAAMARTISNGVEINAYEQPQNNEEIGLTGFLCAHEPGVAGRRATCKEVRAGAERF